MTENDSPSVHMETRLTWDKQHAHTPLAITSQDLTLSWDKPASSQYQPMMLCAQTTGRLKGSHFHWEFFIESLQQQQLGVGVLVDPPDWGFMGYLGAGTNAWSYDPLRGAIVTEMEAIHSGLPTLSDSGVIAVDLDLAEDDSLTFSVNGEPTPPIALPPGCTVIPAASLFALGQKVTLRDFVARKPEVVSLAKARERRARARVSSEAERQKVPRSASARSKPSPIKEIVELAECEAALVKAPGDTELLYQRADLLETIAIYHPDGRDRVLEAYDVILRMKPEDDRAWRKRAFCLYRWDRHQEALESLDRCTRRDADFWKTRAQYLRELGRFEESLSCWRTAHEMEPNDNFLLGHLGSALMKVKRWGEALEVLDRALSVNPHYVFARLERGLCLVGLQRYEDALPVIHEVDATRKMWGTKYLLAYVIFKLGEPDKARRLLEAELSMNPRAHPLDKNGRTVSGIEVEEEFQALASAVYDRYEHLRRE